MMITQTPKWKLVILHHIAAMLGVLIKYEGWPLGSNRNMDFSQTESSGTSASTAHNPTQ